MARTPSVGIPFIATLAEGVATAFVSLSVPASTVAGGVINYTVQANSAAEFQALSGTAVYAAANKAGTTAVTLGADEQAVAVSSGTLTGTLAIADAGAGVVSFTMDATSSLTQTALLIRGVIYPNK